jgi:molybdenum cofactor cytidylyltransferase
MPGVPALFDKTYYDQLLALPDDQGAKKILLQNRHDIWETDFPEGEIDIDTPDDYDAFLRGDSGLRI